MTNPLNKTLTSAKEFFLKLIILMMFFLESLSLGIIVHSIFELEEETRYLWIENFPAKQSRLVKLLKLV